jgi:phage shock protein PspC (stress-responsive transcriptional regulator)
MGGMCSRYGMDEKLIQLFSLICVGVLQGGISLLT